MNVNFPSCHTLINFISEADLVRLTAVLDVKQVCWNKRDAAVRPVHKAALDG